MKTCANCGAVMEDNVKFCTSCGSPLTETPAASAAPVSTQEFATPRYATPVYADEPAPAQQQPAQQPKLEWNQQSVLGQQTPNQGQQQFGEVPHYTTSQHSGQQPYQPQYYQPQYQQMSQERKGMAVLSYFGLIGWAIAYFATNKQQRSPYLTTHLNSGGVLAMCSIVLNILGRVFDSGMLSMVISILSLLVAVDEVIGIVFAIQGKNQPAPLTDSVKLLN